jgi:hypothetical protein
MTRYEWRGVLAGAYANDKAMARMVAHLVDVETGETLCRRVHRDRMCDIPSENEKHCPVCEKRSQPKGETP